MSYIYSRRREDVTDILYSYMPLDLARSLKGSSEGFRTEKHSLVVFIVVLFFCHDFLGNSPVICIMYRARFEQEARLVGETVITCRGTQVLP